MALPPILPVIAEFKKVGPLLAALEATFESLRNDEIVRAIFPRRDALVPNMGLGSKTMMIHPPCLFPAHVAAAN